MKKKIIIVSCILILLCSFWAYFRLRKREARIIPKKEEIVLVDKLETDFLDDVRTSDFIESINGILLSDKVIDTTVIGEYDIPIRYINYQGRIVESSYKLKVVDRIAPIAYINSTYSVKVGSNPEFYKRILCGDNYTSRPDCYFDGEYDLSKEGNYKVKFVAEDESGNQFTKDVTLRVYKPQPSSGSTTTTKKPKTYVTDIIKKHKNDKTKIGLDVSKWQGSIDFKKVKEAGVEFVIIRIGYGYDGEYTIDPRYKENIKNAKEAGLEVGLYFYSYAENSVQAKEDAEWLLKTLDGEELDLPIAFDWEEWGKFNNLGLSFYEFTNMANAFMDTIEDGGYKGMLYSSKTYLENIWMETGHPVWLAHYIENTTYKGEYFLWQLCNNGRVDGIKGDVDIDIMYLK